MMFLVFMIKILLLVCLLQLCAGRRKLKNDMEAYDIGETLLSYEDGVDDHLGQC